MLKTLSTGNMGLFINKIYNQIYIILDFVLLCTRKIIKIKRIKNMNYAKRVMKIKQFELLLNAGKCINSEELTTKYATSG